MMSLGPRFLSFIPAFSFPGVSFYIKQALGPNAITETQNYSGLNLIEAYFPLTNSPSLTSLIHPHQGHRLLLPCGTPLWYCPHIPPTLYIQAIWKEKKEGTRRTGLLPFREQPRSGTYHFCSLLIGWKFMEELHLAGYKGDHKMYLQLDGHMQLKILTLGKKQRIDI